MAAIALLVSAAAIAPALAWIDAPFDTTTASVMHGLLDGGPNRDCVFPGDPTDTSYPAPFVFHNGNPAEQHLYQAYELYNNGPQRCVQVQLLWTHQDCGNIELGIGLYLGSFNPNDPRENLIAHSFEYARDFFDLGEQFKYNQYRYSPGYYRIGGLQYHLDDLMLASAVVPALSKVIAVVDSRAQPGANEQCPNNPATSSLAVLPYLLDQKPLAVEVHDTSSYEFDSPGANLDFYVSLSTQFDQSFTIDYHTSDITALDGSDYTMKMGQITFMPGQTTKLVQVPIVSDTTEENPPTETMKLTLSNPSSPFVAITQAEGIGTIYDDDAVGQTCHITNYVGNGDLPVGKVGVPYGPVDLRGFDFQFDPTLEYQWSQTGGMLPPGVMLTETSVEDPPMSMNFEMHGSLSGTPTQAGTYTFTVHLICPIDDPDPGTPPPNTFDAEFTIVIEPEAPQAILTLPDVAVVEGNSGLTPVPMHILLSQALGSDLPLEILLFDGSAAIADNDYQQLASIPQPTQVTSGDTDEPFQLDVVGDTNLENDETFLVQLRTPVAHEIVATAKVTIINDDFPAAAIPTLGEIGLGVFAIGIAGAGVRVLRRRRSSSRPRPG